MTDVPADISALDLVVSVFTECRGSLVDYCLRAIHDRVQEGRAKFGDASDSRDWIGMGVEEQADAAWYFARAGLDLPLGLRARCVMLVRHTRDLMIEAEALRRDVVAYLQTRRTG